MKLNVSILYKPQLTSDLNSGRKDLRSRRRRGGEGRPGQSGPFSALSQRFRGAVSQEF